MNTHKKYRIVPLLVLGVGLTVLAFQHLSSNVAAQVLRHNELIQIAAASEEWVYVTGSRVNVRTEPSVSAARITSFPRGTRLRALSRSGTWTEVLEPQAGVTGWMHSDYLSATPIAAEQRPSDAEIKRVLIQQSIARYSGSCPCPYNVDRGGRRCGGRSAYSRPGGYAPLCYESDVTQEMVERYRRSH